ncbi:MAG: hypothetical protein QOJ34_1380, partial [Pseudonocardiales bacterium]|nr:hypothetical protein [Pseudonocardiales bacterium]
MRLLKRRESAPVELVTALGKDERVVSWADTDDGGVVAATQRGLWWPEPEGPRCMPWQFIDK